MDLVNARADEGPTAHYHGGRAVKHARNYEGLVRPASDHAYVEAHVVVVVVVVDVMVGIELAHFCLFVGTRVSSIFVK